MYTYYALVCPSVNFALYYTTSSLVKSNTEGIYLCAIEYPLALCIPMRYYNTFYPNIYKMFITFSSHMYLVKWMMLMGIYLM